MSLALHIGLQPSCGTVYIQVAVPIEPLPWVARGTTAKNYLLSGGSSGSNSFSSSSVI